MSERQERVLDAAITVLGTRGLRQLTHRTVDAEAGLPLGSTSNLFRSREALIRGVLDRLVAVETAAWQQLTGSHTDFPTMLAELIRNLAGPAKAVTLARHAIFHEAAFHPGLQQKIASAREELASWGVPWVAQLGSKAPAQDYQTLLALIDGLLSNQLASPSPDFDPLPAIVTVLRGMSK
ncbi:MAG TPA: TetR family transcriptional regulator [Micromonosporaceae bacterium]|nr:TetR family transcriptional regulator [Micromonosporaceae bacterium]